MCGAVDHFVKAALQRPVLALHPCMAQTTSASGRVQCVRGKACTCLAGSRVAPGHCSARGLSRRGEPYMRIMESCSLTV